MLGGADLVGFFTKFFDTLQNMIAGQRTFRNHVSARSFRGLARDGFADLQTSLKIILHNPP